MVFDNDTDISIIEELLRPGQYKVIMYKSCLQYIHLFSVLEDKSLS